MAPVRAHPQALVRWRPAILVAIGVATGYCAYLVYATITPNLPDPQKPTLQRRGAVHRRRHDDRVLADTASSPFQDALVGELIVRGISTSEVTQAMIRAGVSETVSTNIVEHAANSVAHRLQHISDAAAAQRRDHLMPQDPPPQGRVSGEDIKSVLYYIAEEQSRQKAYIHHGIRCDICGEMPIRGVRWHCSNCTDYDLCSNCEARNRSRHFKTHVFHKITIPALHLSKSWKVEPVWYPGNPFLTRGTLDKDLVKQLSNDCSYEPFEVEAIYDQFTCVANVEWREDPLNVGAAIDRSAFGRSIMPHTRLRPPPPNLIYERCFAFYDTDNNGLIGFDEFIHGLAYIHKRAFRDQRLGKIFDGYDLDSDGCISRKDFLRMFRALYVVQRELTNDMITVQEEQAADEPRSDLINSNQPLSSAFRERFVPGSLLRRPGKSRNHFGDLLPESGYSTVVDETNETAFMRTQADGDQDSTRSVSVHRSLDAVEGDILVPGSCEAENEVGSHEGDESDALENADGTEIGSNHEEDPAERSRSSSRVRFKDEPEDDARSQTSTSSRPVGERWGGYEIPEAEADIGRDPTYAIVQESLNLALDPLFKAAEDLAVEIKKTVAERRKWKDLLDMVDRESCALERYKRIHNNRAVKLSNAEERDDSTEKKGEIERDSTHPSAMLEAQQTLGQLDCLTTDDYVKGTKVLSHSNAFVQWALPYLERMKSPPSLETRSNMFKDYVEGVQNEANAIIGKIINAFPDAPTAHPLYRDIKDVQQQALAARDMLEVGIDGTDGGIRTRLNGNIPKGAETSSDGHQLPLGACRTSDQAPNDPSLDPTLPQFRPNSSADVTSLESQRSATWSWSATPKSSTPGAGTAQRPLNELLRLPTPPPSRMHLRYLAKLNKEEREQRQRGVTGGKLGFEEFESAMNGSAGKRLDFLDDWLTLISF
ncbi:MAG: hypothetical protein Q9165_008271 [Trypethelium subeluteriae]